MLFLFSLIFTQSPQEKKPGFVVDAVISGLRTYPPWLEVLVANGCHGCSFPGTALGWKATLLKITPPSLGVTNIQRVVKDQIKISASCLEMGQLWRVCTWSMAPHGMSWVFGCDCISAQPPPSPVLCPLPTSPGFIQSVLPSKLLIHESLSQTLNSRKPNLGHSPSFSLHSVFMIKNEPYGGWLVLVKHGCQSRVLK